MTVEKIVKNCLSDPEDPENAYVKLLSERENKPAESEFIQDLKFKIKLPQEIRIDDVAFQNVLINFEPQTINPSDYSIVIRMELYAFQQIVNENWLFYLNKTKDMYKHIVPLWEFLFCFDPKIKESVYMIYGFLPIKHVNKDGEPKYFDTENKEEHSLVTLYEIYFGNDIEMDEKNPYSFLNKLLVSDEKGIIVKTFNDYGFKTDREDLKMMFTGLERKYLIQGEKRSQLVSAKLMFQNSASFDCVSQSCPSLNTDDIKKIQQEALNSNY